MIVLQGGRLVDPASGTDGQRTVVIEGGKITRILERPPAPGELQGATRIDCSGKLILPGLIDLHAHLREPGEEYKETILTGSRSAVAGGFTAIVAMPNTKPVIDNAHLVRFVVEKGREAGLARVYPSGAVSRGQEGKELAEYGDMKAAGAVALTDDGKPVLDAGMMRRALEYASAFDLPIMVHEEELSLAAGGSMHEGPVATRLGLKGSPAAAEEVMVRRDLALCELTGGRLHIGHVSAAGSVRAIREAKSRGIRVTAEATPHHFTLTDDAVATYDTHAKMCPPLRSAQHVRAVKEGLADGTLDAIATDHAPHSAVEKELEFDRAANGIIGLETALPLTLRLVEEGVLTLARAVELLSWGPARCFGLPGGRLAIGEPADVVVVDPAATWRAESFLSRSKNSPFTGWTLRGRALHTLVGGAFVHGGPAPDGEGR